MRTIAQLAASEQLDVGSAFNAIAPGLSPLEHRERYGYDLSWIDVRGRRLSCAGCGAIAQGHPDDPIGLVALMAGTFIEIHARCARGSHRRAASWVARSSTSPMR